MPNKIGFQTVDDPKDIRAAAAGFNSGPLLGPKLDFTDALSRDEYVSVSFIKPVLQLFNTSLLEMQEGDTDFTKNIKKKILDFLNEKNKDDDTQKLQAMASFLDPRVQDGLNQCRQEVKARMASQMMECHETSRCSTDVEPNVTKPRKCIENNSLCVVSAVVDWSEGAADEEIILGDFTRLPFLIMVTLAMRSIEQSSLRGFGPLVLWDSFAPLPFYSPPSFALTVSLLSRSLPIPDITQGE
ncbi:hypothetical protein FQN60_012617, partial [Etheostoma spectabile]